MKLHANAALTLSQRRRMVRLVVDEKWPISAAAAEFHTVCSDLLKWVARYREASEAGLLDRSSACRVLADRSDERRLEAIAALRRLRFSGPEIAELLDMPLSTVSGILTRIGMGRLGRLGLEPAQRYERARPGELIHIDVKKLGRIVGRRRQAVARRRGRYAAGASPTPRGGGAARPAGSSFTSPSTTPPGWPTPKSCGDETARTAVGFLRRALAFYASYGIAVERLITDNGSAYRSAIDAIACRALGIRHLRTRPHRPQTNGKAERFIRTMLGGWAYGAIYRSSRERTAALDGWLFTYNHHRRHAGIGRRHPSPA